MSFKFEIRWNYSGKNAGEIDPVFFLLLKSIRQKGSLRSAAEETGISYRHAWGLIRYWSTCISKPIVKLEQGRGAKLTEIGDKLLWAEQLVTSKLASDLNQISEELNIELSNLLDKSNNPGKLRINASHGLAIAQLQSLLAESEAFDIDFHFRGSLESLRELANSRCDIAGFHIPTGNISLNLAPMYLQWLTEEKHKLIHVATRQQGLMIQKKNLKKITSLKSLTRRSVRFINRQKESGTRTIFDELLRISNISKSSIKGYQDEEFTHVAVAALIASGAADAGFGIKAAASKFGLHFIPVISENYVLAIDKAVSKKSISELKKILRSRQFKSRVDLLPGYDIKSAGNEITFGQIFSGK